MTIKIYYMNIRSSILVLLITGAFYTYFTEPGDLLEEDKIYLYYSDEDRLELDKAMYPNCYYDGRMYTRMSIKPLNDSALQLVGVIGPEQLRHKECNDTVCIIRLR